MNRLGLKAIALATLTVLGLAGESSCKRRDDGTEPRAETKSLPPLALRDDTPNLMLTWIDEKGDTHVDLHPADVPAEGRTRVRVVVSDREDGTRDLFYVADLTRKRDDGTYATSSVRRRDWEADLERRRDAYLAKVAPPPPAGSPNAVEPPAGNLAKSNVRVIIYGASWCGPCHQAADYLKSKGISYVLKDVEETPGAAAELKEKLTRAGRRGGSIPVMDVGGQILVGFSPAAVDQALAKATAGTNL